MTLLNFCILILVLRTALPCIFQALFAISITDGFLEFCDRVGIDTDPLDPDDLFDAVVGRVIRDLFFAGWILAILHWTGLLA